MSLITLLKRTSKSVLKQFLFKAGSVKRIYFGPMKGMRFVFSDSSGFAAIYSGNERANQYVYRQIVKTGDAVIDAGANWGMHSLYLARLVGTSGRVFSFEPSPETFAELSENLRLNGLNQVTAVQKALADKLGELKFSGSGASKTRHLLSDSSEEKSKAKESFTFVQVTTIDQFVDFQNLDKLSMIKVDVEGAEHSLLVGATKTIQRFRPQLVIELHSPEQDLAVAALLSLWNYRISRVEGPEITRVDRSWPDPAGVWGTILAVPN